MNKWTGSPAASWALWRGTGLSEVRLCLLPAPPLENVLAQQRTGHLSGLCPFTRSLCVLQCRRRSDTLSGGCKGMYEVYFGKLHFTGFVLF